MLVHPSVNFSLLLLTDVCVYVCENTRASSGRTCIGQLTHLNFVAVQPQTETCVCVCVYVCLCVCVSLCVCREQTTHIHTDQEAGEQ